MAKLIIALFLIITIGIAPHLAYAVTPTQAIGAAINASSAFSGVPIVGGLFETASASIAAVLKKKFFDLMVDQIVVWIQGGGKPLFIDNWELFLGQYANIVTGDIVYELGMGAVCRPFGIQLQLAVLQPPRFTNQISCTLDQIVGNALNFYNNFRNGGFIAYREMWQPRNNFYGALILAMDEKETRIADQRYAAQQEAQAGGGFLGTRKCDPATGFCYITTPGMQIGAAAAKIVGADLDYIINAQDLAAYVAAISDAFINRLIREGVNGLRGVVAANAPPLGYISQQQAGQQTPCGGLTGDTLNTCLAYQGALTNNANATRKAYLNQIKATLLPLQLAENDLQNMITNQRTLVTRVTELRDCRVGRNNGDKEAVIAELNTEQTTLNDITQGLIDLQTITVPLLNLKLQLENPPSNNPQELNQLFTSAFQLLNENEAKTYQTETKQRHDALTTKVTQRLPHIQTQSQQCLGS